MRKMHAKQSSGSRSKTYDLSLHLRRYFMWVSGDELAVAALVSTKCPAQIWIQVAVISILGSPTWPVSRYLSLLSDGPNH